MVDLSTFDNKDVNRFETTMQSTRTAGIKNLYLSGKGIPKLPYYRDFLNASERYISDSRNIEAAIKQTYGGSSPALSFLGEWASNSSQVLVYFELDNEDWLDNSELPEEPEEPDEPDPVFTTSSSWRLNITANEDDSTYSAQISEIVFIDETNADLSTAGGIFSATSEFSSSYSADKAFDGSTSTFWSTNDAVFPVIITAELSSEVAVTGVKITSADGGRGARAPSDFTLEYKDSLGSWQVLFSVTGSRGWSELEQRTFTL